MRKTTKNPRVINLLTFPSTPTSPPFGCCSCETRPASSIFDPDRWESRVTRRRRRTIGWGGGALSGLHPRSMCTGDMIYHQWKTPAYCTFQNAYLFPKFTGKCLDENISLLFINRTRRWQPATGVWCGIASVMMAASAKPSSKQQQGFFDVFRWLVLRMRRHISRDALQSAVACRGRRHRRLSLLCFVSLISLTGMCQTFQ